MGVQANLRTQRSGQWICHGTVMQGCSCVLTNRTQRNEMGAVTVEGQKLTFTKDGAQSGQPADFCVRGNVLTYQDSGGAVYTAIKQP